MIFTCSVPSFKPTVNCKGLCCCLWLVPVTVEQKVKHMQTKRMHGVSVYWPICPSITCLSVCLLVHLSIYHLSVYILVHVSSVSLPVYWSIYLSIIVCQSIGPPIDNYFFFIIVCLSAYWSTCPSIHLSVCQSATEMSVYLLICSYICLADENASNKTTTFFQQFFPKILVSSIYYHVTI